MILIQNLDTKSIQRSLKAAELTGDGYGAFWFKLYKSESEIIYTKYIQYGLFDSITKIGGYLAIFASLAKGLITVFGQDPLDDEAEAVLRDRGEHDPTNE